MKKITKNAVFSFSLIIISYGFITYKIINLKELKNISFEFNNYTLKEFVILFIVFILMFLNWSIETFKWKFLIKKIQNLSFFSAFKAVFAGITIGIFTPNRIGEIGGRVLFLEKGKRTIGIFKTGIGSFAQFITTILTGILGLVLFLILFPGKAKMNPLFNNMFVLILTVTLVILIWGYFNIEKIKPLLLKLAFFNKRKDQLEYISDTQIYPLIWVLILSIVRYIIFISQFYLLLLFFKIELTPSQAFISISLLYLFSTIIPTTTLAELGIKGSLSIFFIGFFSKNILGIILATIILWLINLAIPSIIGSIFFIKNKLNLTIN